MEEVKWYEQLTYGEAKEILEEKLVNIKKSFIAAGYYLKYIRDNQLYLEDGYKTIWEFAEENYGITRTTASRWMAINDKFSKAGNTPILDEAYKDFGKSQLQEMLYLDDKQMENVTPDMTKKEIRELRAPKKEESLSVLGFPRKTYSDGSLISTPGCDRYTCFSCHHEGCEIRGEECYCVEASMGNPFPCTTLNVVENLKEDIGASCQFVNKDLAFHRAGDKEPVPCCKNCENPCGYQCRRSVENRDRQEKTEEEPEQLAAVIEEEKCAPAHIEKEPETLGNTSTPLDEESNCPPDQSYCPRQEWGTSPQQQHEGAKECAKCWNEWKRTQKILQKEDKSEEQEVERIHEKESEEILPEETKQVAAVEENIIDVESTEVSEEKYEELSVKTDEDILKELLDSDKRLLNNMKKCFSDNDIRVRKQSIKVAALAGMLSDVEILEEKIEQPEFPKLKNMDEREDFVLNYKTWPVWTKNELTEETYYRYELLDGSAIVVREYPYTTWREEVLYGKVLFLVKQDTKHFKDGETNMTALKEHLKEVQKGNIC